MINLLGQDVVRAFCPDVQYLTYYFRGMRANILNVLVMLVQGVFYIHRFVDFFFKIINLHTKGETSKGTKPEVLAL